MDYEKKYKEAIKKAKSKIKNDKDHVLYEDDIIEIFPELAESKDERIRKRIIHALHGDVLEMSEIKEAVDWLEKQGKQKPTDKIEPKFKIGDIISNDISEVTIVSIDKNYYIVTNDEIENDANVCNWVIYFKNQDDWKLVERKSIDKVEPKFKVEKDKWYVCISQYCNCIEGRNYKATSDGRIIDDYGTEYDMHSDAYKWFRPWTIQDAKDGDVLYMDNGLSTCTFIYKSIDNVIIQKYASYNKFGFEGTTYLVLNDGYVCPATKEQRELLFKKMKEAGYEWDAEKKELKKIEQTSADETPYPETLEKAIDLYYYSYGNGKGEFEHLSLEKFRDIVLTFVSDYGQKPAWSEEDEAGLGDALWCCKQAASIAKDENDMGNIWYAENWLKSLKDRVQLQNGYNLYKEVVESIAEMCKHYDKANHSGLRDFYDNVKVKCKDAKEYESLFPQHIWKPSNKQMKAIEHICDGNYNVDLDILDSIYRDFKKLREE